MQKRTGISMLLAVLFLTSVFSFHTLFAEDDQNEEKTEGHSKLTGDNRLGDVDPWAIYSRGYNYIAKDSLEKALQQYDLLKYKGALQSTLFRLHLLLHPGGPELLYPDFQYIDGLKAVVSGIVWTFTPSIDHLYVSSTYNSRNRIQSMDILGWGIIIDDEASIVTSSQNLSGIVEARLQTTTSEPDNSEKRTWEIQDHYGDIKETLSKYINDEYVIFSCDLDDDAYTLPPVKYDGFSIGDSVFILQNPLSYNGALTMAVITNVGEDPLMGNMLMLDPDSNLIQETGFVSTPAGELVGLIVIPKSRNDKNVFAFTLKDRTRFNPKEKLSINQFAEHCDSVEIYHKKNSRLYSLYREGQEYVWSSEYENAVKSFSDITTKDSSHACAHLYLGFCYNKLGDTEKAIHHFQMASEIDLNLVEAPYHLGLLYLGINEPEEAIEEFEKCEKINDNNPYPLFMLAKTYQSLDKKRLVKKYRHLLWTVDKDLAEQLE